MSDKAWADMTAQEKRAYRIEKWRNPGVVWASPDAEAAYKSRIDRVLAAINLEKPDRVPVRLNTGFWPAKTAGITPYEAMTDAAKGGKAWKDFNIKFQPDLSCDPVHNTVPASMFESITFQM